MACYHCFICNKTIKKGDGSNCRLLHSNTSIEEVDNSHGYHCLLHKNTSEWPSFSSCQANRRMKKAMAIYCHHLLCSNTIRKEDDDINVLSYFFLEFFSSFFCSNTTIEEGYAFFATKPPKKATTKPPIIVAFFATKPLKKVTTIVVAFFIVTHL
jgi:hypothetical protein